MDQMQLLEQLADVIREVHDLQSMKGLVLQLPNEQSPTRITARTIGISIQPTAFPEKRFRQAQSLQESMNLLYMRASSDYLWLDDVLTPLLAIDPMVRALWTILTNAKQRQPISCGIFSSDYLCAKGDDEPLRQVEVNTFAVAGLSYNKHAATLHKRLRRSEMLGSRSSMLAKGEIPHNDNVSEAAALLQDAYHLYTPSNNQKQMAILIVVQDTPQDIDARSVQYSIEDRDITCLLCRWSDVQGSTRLDNGTLILKGPEQQHEVAVIYYRAGVTLAEYDETGIQTRIMLESSTAIKCPDIRTHLTTLKSVQCALAQPGVVERFLPAKEAESVRSTFVSMQTLDKTPAGSQAIELAKNQRSAENYVLKPNLEQSIGNVFGKQIARYMCRVPEQELPRYTLMQAIQAVSAPGLLLREHMVYEGQVTSELGILGGCIWRRSAQARLLEEADIIVNRTIGWAFRSKPVDVRQSSIIRGFGCIDSPLLT